MVSQQTTYVRMEALLIDDPKSVEDEDMADDYECIEIGSEEAAGSVEMSVNAHEIGVVEVQEPVRVAVRLLLQRTMATLRPRS